MFLINLLIVPVTVRAAENKARMLGERFLMQPWRRRPPGLLWWNAPKKPVARRNPGVVKKPALTFQRPDSQHQLTLLALACARSFHTLTLNSVKESGLSSSAFGIPDTARPSLLPFVISEGARREVNHLYVDPAWTVGAISDNLPLPFATRRNPRPPDRHTTKKRRLHWRELLRCSYKPPPLGGTLGPAALESTFTFSNLQKNKIKKKDTEREEKSNNLVQNFSENLKFSAARKQLNVQPEAHSVFFPSTSLSCDRTCATTWSNTRS